MAEALEKEQLIREQLVHPLILEIRGKGLMLAIMTPAEEIATEIILKAQEKGLILFWLLFEKKAVRITPPLTISNEEIKEGCGIIIEILNTITPQSLIETEMLITLLKTIC
jgi:acetylornithine/N-succinyldiaminopimelate aminotransferase